MKKVFNSDGINKSKKVKCKNIKQQEKHNAQVYDVQPTRWKYFFRGRVLHQGELEEIKRVCTRKSLRLWWRV